jgi:phosphoribosyl-ATP pyrophosphohydrolase
MAQKVVEEAAEVAIDAVRAERDAVVRESADLLYNLTVLLTELDIHPSEVWHEMDRRREILGIAEKLPKPIGEEKPEDPGTSGSDPSPSPSPPRETRSWPLGRPLPPDPGAHERTGLRSRSDEALTDADDNVSTILLSSPGLGASKMA